MSVSGGYFRRGFHHLINSTNLATTLSDYTPIAIANPMSGEPVTIYSLAPAKIGLVNILDATSTQNKQTYDGYEATFDGRFINRLRVFGGLTIGRTRSVSCDVQDDPNRLRFCDQTQFDIPFQPQYKLSGSYQLPAGFNLSGVFASYPGALLNVNYLVNRTIAPGLSQSQISVPLAAPGSQYIERLTQLDVRVGKTVRVRGVELQAAFDVFNATNSDAVFNRSADVRELARPSDRRHPGPAVPCRHADEVLNRPAPGATLHVVTFIRVRSRCFVRPYAVHETTNGADGDATGAGRRTGSRNEPQ